MNARRSQSGFSLIELAVVLVIVGLLVGGGIAALNSATQQTRRIEAERQLQHVRNALYGYAMSEGRLPCPDTTYPPDGTEDCGGGAEGGAVPWTELGGLGRRDPWGSPLRYRVDRNSPDFADPAADQNNPAFGIGPTENGSITVRDADNSNITTDSPAVVVSYGPQGSQIWTDSGFTCIAAGTDGFSEDENENCDDDNTFVAAEPRPPDVPNPTAVGGGRFDDVIIWIPTPVLKARMVDAGLLP
ncbi:MAG: prepilin-type N-terminal cleavage/methylation domain-containing protein [Halofilum sp. (in: g-proteobacteria)]|nr:prepilin-type N-terminal cleavage/methylation domain-containing protein [Halofilum sp. (in: g-proteobacteria)]